MGTSAARLRSGHPLVSFFLLLSFFFSRVVVATFNRRTKLAECKRSNQRRLKRTAVEQRPFTRNPITVLYPAS